MIVDSSALMAILRDEPEAEYFAEALAQEPGSRMSVVNWVEAAVVVDSARDPVASRRFDKLIDAASIHLVEVTVEQASAARQAYRDFGKGSGHPARLNFGDCFAYALATLRREPMLYKGDDFVHTDLPALG